MNIHKFTPNLSSLWKIVLLLGVITALCGCSASQPKPSVLNQISAFTALEKGYYDGDVTYAQMKNYGDFGLGTFDALDGEMIALDGVFYQAKADGSVAPAPDNLEVPFADVHFFTASSKSDLPAPVDNADALKKVLDGLRSKPNDLYAFRIKGTFPYVKIRSVPAQEAPYPSLNDAVANQVTFELENIPGTMVGYWMPKYLVNMGVPGYHLHFISDDRTKGGHMLDCKADKAVIEVDQLENMTIVLPQTDLFQNSDLTKEEAAPSKAE